jgi:UDP-glucuronate decarboxylase
VIDPVPAHLRADRCAGAACGTSPAPASPPRYQRDPEHTLLTSVLGTRNLLQLAEASNARFLLTSTSEVYGDPERTRSGGLLGATSTAPAPAPATTRASGRRRR